MPDLSYDIIFLLGGGIGNIIEALYAVEYCVNNNVRTGILFGNINKSFKQYLHECYDNVIISDELINNIFTINLIHSFAFQDHIIVPHKNYFYIKPDNFSSAYHSETEQYLNVVKALFPSSYDSCHLKSLVGKSSARVNDLQIERKLVLYCGCSCFKAVSRWPYYLDLENALGSNNTIFVGGADDLNSEYSYIYPSFITKVLPQKMLNQRKIWNLLKQLKVLRPFSHYNILSHYKNGFFDFFTWSELVEIFRRCQFFVGNDGGLTHLAAASGANGIVIFGATSINKSRPYSPLIEVLSTHHSCQPCFFGAKGITMSSYFINCPNQIRCLSDISVDAVLNKIESCLCKDLLTRQK